eukprot:scaffold73297_cov63-Phaeocystis_antarctica.AAC.3
MGRQRRGRRRGGRRGLASRERLGLEQNVAAAAGRAPVRVQMERGVLGFGKRKEDLEARGRGEQREHVGGLLPRHVARSHRTGLVVLGGDEPCLRAVLAHAHARLLRRELVGEPLVSGVHHDHLLAVVEASGASSARLMQLDNVVLELLQTEALEAGLASSRHALHDANGVHELVCWCGAILTADRLENAQGIGVRYQGFVRCCGLRLAASTLLCGWKRTARGLDPLRRASASVRVASVISLAFVRMARCARCALGLAGVGLAVAEAHGAERRAWREPRVASVRVASVRVTSVRVASVRVAS